MAGLESLSPWLIAYVAVVIAVAGWIQGALGLGFPMIATPLIAAATSMQFAVVMVLIPCIATVIVSILRSPGFATILQRFWWISIVALLGAAAGAKLFVMFPGFPYALLLAGVILFYLNLQRLGLSQWPVMQRNEKSFGLLFGFLGGLSESTANIAAPPLIIYYLGIGLQPLLLVPAMNISFFTGKATQLATLAPSGIATIEQWLLTLPLAVVATIASWQGSGVRSRIDGPTYRLWMQRMLLAMALILLVQVAWDFLQA
ncbi:MAG: TSUP family transporter [Burkholderiales bacterium]|nr:TSUP family transporter [Burkholderiales bacterium]